MEKHIRLIGLLYIVWGFMGLIGVLVSFVLMMGAGFAIGVAADESIPFWLAGGLGTVLLMILLVTSLPNLLVGWGLLKKSSWARILGIILSVLNLPAFPFGTALGIYGLIVLLHGESIYGISANLTPRQYNPNVSFVGTNIDLFVSLIK